MLIKYQFTNLGIVKSIKKYFRNKSDKALISALKKQTELKIVTLNGGSYSYRTDNVPKSYMSECASGVRLARWVGSGLSTECQALALAARPLRKIICYYQ